jgi:hypothetical protein
MNPNKDEQPNQSSNITGDFAFSKTVLPGSKLEINQENEAFSTTILPDSKMEISQAQNKPSYSTLLENRLLNLRKPVAAEIPKTIPQTITEPVQPITENLPQVGTPLFTPPQNRFTPNLVENSSDNLFSLPLPAPLGIISPAEAVTKVAPLFNQTLSIPTTVPNIPPSSLNQVPNLTQFQTPTPATTQINRPAIQNNIAPGPRNVAPPIIGNLDTVKEKPEITPDDLKGIKLSTARNGAVISNIVKYQSMLKMARNV